MARLRLPMPIELAGLTGRMERAGAQERQIQAIGRRYDKVQDDIDDAIDTHNEHVDDLEHYRDAWQRKVDSMVVKTNGGGDPLDGAKAGQSGQSSVGVDKGQGGSVGDSHVVTEADVGKIDPEHLTVNGVTVEPDA